MCGRWCGLTHGRTGRRCVERHRGLNRWCSDRRGFCDRTVAFALGTLTTTLSTIRTIRTITTIVAVTTTCAALTTWRTISALLWLHDGGDRIGRVGCGNITRRQLGYRRCIGVTRRTIATFATRAALTTFAAIRTLFARLALRFGGVGARYGQSVNRCRLWRTLITLLTITRALLAVTFTTTFAFAIATILAVAAIISISAVLVAVATITVAITAAATVVAIIAVTAAIAVTTITTAITTRVVTLLVFGLRGLCHHFRRGCADAEN